MKTLQRAVAVGVLGYAAMTAGFAAWGGDAEGCRGGYPVLLMTPEECRGYLDQLDAVRARADRLAELELREWHTALLIERAAACPCRAGEHIVLSQRAAVPQARPKLPKQ